MQIIEIKNRRFTSILYLVGGIILLIIGIRLLVISSFDLKDYKKIKGTISYLEIKDYAGIDNFEQKKLIIKLKEDSADILSENVSLIDNLKLKDTIEVYAKLSIDHKNSYYLYGLIRKDQTIMDYKESVRIKIWGGLFFTVLGLIIIMFNIVNLRKAKEKESVLIDKDSYFLNF